MCRSMPSFTNASTPAKFGFNPRSFDADGNDHGRKPIESQGTAATMTVPTTSASI